MFVRTRWVFRVKIDFRGGGRESDPKQKTRDRALVLCADLGAHNGY